MSRLAVMGVLASLPGSTLKRQQEASQALSKASERSQSARQPCRYPAQRHRQAGRPGQPRPGQPARQPVPGVQLDNTTPYNPVHGRCPQLLPGVEILNDDGAITPLTSHMVGRVRGLGGNYGGRGGARQTDTRHEHANTTSRRVRRRNWLLMAMW